MKKILIAMVLFALMALPMSAMALTTIDDSDLSTVTGQAGVSIGADITMDLSMGKVAWGDIDGLGNDDVAGIDGGWVGISNLNITNLRIHMRGDMGMVDYGVAYSLYTGIMAETDAPAFSDFQILAGGNDPQALSAVLLSILATEQLLTIDIYTDNVPVTPKTYVRIGLPTFEITMDDLTLNVGLFTNTTANTPGTYQSLGQVYVGGLEVLVEKDNYVDISQNDTTSGVLIKVSNLTPGDDLMSLHFDAVSWGDLDGLNAFDEAVQGTADAGAGYVGIRSMTLGISMDMLMNINVATTGSRAFDELLPLVDAYTSYLQVVGPGGLKEQILGDLAANDKVAKELVSYILHTVGTISKTSVDIALSGSIGVSTMATQVVLADNAALLGSFTGNVDGTAGILGNFYIQGLDVTIKGTAGAATTEPQSWVSISAH